MMTLAKLHKSSCIGHAGPRHLVMPTSAFDDVHRVQQFEGSIHGSMQGKMHSGLIDES